MVPMDTLTVTFHNYIHVYISWIIRPSLFFRSYFLMVHLWFCGIILPFWIYDASMWVTIDGFINGGNMGYGGAYTEVGNVRLWSDRSRGKQWSLTVDNNTSIVRRLKNFTKRVAAKGSFIGKPPKLSSHAKALLPLWSGHRKGVVQSLLLMLRHCSYLGYTTFQIFNLCARMVQHVIQ